MGAIVQFPANANQASSATPTVTITGVGAGRTLLLWIMGPAENRSYVSVAGGETWAQLDQQQETNFDGGSSVILAAHNVAGGDYTFTVTMSGTDTFTVIAVEVSGMLSASTPVDQVAGGSTGAISAQTLTLGPTSATAQNNEFLLAFGYQVKTGRAFAPTDPSGWTRAINRTDNGYDVLWTKEQTVAAAQSVTLDTSPNTDSCILGHLITLKEVVAPVTDTDHRATDRALDRGINRGAF